MPVTSSQRHTAVDVRHWGEYACRVKLVKVCLVAVLVCAAPGCTLVAGCLGVCPTQRPPSDSSGVDTTNLRVAADSVPVSP